MTTNTETVTNPKSEYDALLKREFWLDCLEAAGVDNWQGYDEAFEIKREWEKELADKAKS